MVALRLGIADVVEVVGCTRGHGGGGVISSVGSGARGSGNGIRGSGSSIATSAWLPNHNLRRFQKVDISDISKTIFGTLPKIIYLRRSETVNIWEIVGSGSGIICSGSGPSVAIVVVVGYCFACSVDTTIGSIGRGNVSASASSKDIGSDGWSLVVVRPAAATVVSSVGRTKL